MTQLPFEDLPETPASLLASNRFDEFWSYAIRKIAKKDARKAYAAAILRANEDWIMTAWIEFNKRALGQCRIVQIEHQFVPYPVTWLRQDRWEDDYCEPIKPHLTHQQILESAAWKIRQGTSNGHQFQVDRAVARECVDKGLVTEEQARAWL